MKEYKTFKNYIRKFSRIESLKILWWYFNYLYDGNREIPKGIEFNRRFLGNNPAITILQPWKLIRIVEEILIAGKDLPEAYCKKSFRSWNHLAECINKISFLEECISDKKNDKSNVFNDLFRTQHQQFYWQDTSSFKDDLTKYLTIYSHSRLSSLIENVFGCSINKIFKMGVSIWGGVLKSHSMRSEIEINNIDCFSKKEINLFRDRFTITLHEAVDLIGKARKSIDESFFHGESVLHEYPMIQLDEKEESFSVCPVPQLFFSRFTKGLYYDLGKKFGYEGSFGDAFGEAVQDYVGEILKRTKSEFFHIVNDGGDRDRSTVDWVYHNDRTALFIEVKSKRITFKTKKTLEAPLELDDLVQFLFQGYKAISFYKSSDYVSLKNVQRIKNIYLIITTLEPWYSLFDEHKRYVDLKLKEFLKEERIGTQLLVECPYLLCSVQELEEAIQVIQQVEVNKFFECKHKADKRFWTLEKYIGKEYPEEKKNTKELFVDKFELIRESFSIRAKNSQ